MLGRAGGAQRRHGIRKAQLRQRHHVHIALGHQHQAVFADGSARLKQAVQLAPFVEHRGFGRIEVFGLFVTKHAPAKANAFAFDVADREHQPIAKTVVAAHIVGVLIVDDDQARLGQQRVVVLRKHARQPMPALGRVAQAIAVSDIAGHAPALQIVNRVLGGAQVLAVGGAGFFQHIGQGGLLLFACGGAFALLRRDIVLGHL